MYVRHGEGIYTHTQEWGVGRTGEEAQVLNGELCPMGTGRPRHWGWGEEGAGNTGVCVFLQNGSGVVGASGNGRGGVCGVCGHVTRRSWAHKKNTGNTE